MSLQGSDVDKDATWLGQFGATQENVEDHKFIAQLAMQSDNKEKGERGLSAFVSKQLLTRLSEQEKFALASEVALARYQETGNGAEVFRNQEQFSRAFFNEVFTQFDYPTGLADRAQYFALFESAAAGNEQAQSQLQQSLADPPAKLIESLLPFYHDFLQDPKNASGKGKKDFGDFLIFAFVETKAAELSVVDGMSPQKKGELSKALRVYKRDQNLGQSMVQKLDEANKNYIAKPVSNFQNTQIQMRQAVKGYAKFKADNQAFKDEFEPHAMKVQQLCKEFASKHKDNKDPSENMRSIGVLIENAIKNEIEYRELQGHSLNEPGVRKINQFVQNQLNKALALAEQQNDKAFITGFKEVGAVSTKVDPPTLLSRVTTAAKSFLTENVLPLLNKAVAALQGFPSFNAMKANWQGAKIESAKVFSAVQPENNPSAEDTNRQLHALGDTIAHFGSKPVQSKKVSLDVAAGPLGIGNNPLYQPKDKDPTAPITKQAIHPVHAKGAILTAYPTVTKTLISVSPPLDKPLIKPEPPTGKSPRAKN